MLYMLKPLGCSFRFRTGTRTLFGRLVAFAVSALTVLMPPTSSAVNYECETEQVSLWDNGRLVPQNDKFNGVHDIFHFNGDNGDLWSASDKDEFLNPMPFKIIKTMLHHRELFAVYAGGEDKWVAGSSFRIRGHRIKSRDSCLSC